MRDQYPTNTIMTILPVMSIGFTSVHCSWPPRSYKLVSIFPSLPSHNLAVCNKCVMLGGLWATEKVQYHM